MLTVSRESRESLRVSVGLGVCRGCICNPRDRYWQGVKSEDIKASIKDGVLRVTFPSLVPETVPAKRTIA
ncbi:hypothetical protein BJV74DRAFT_853972 [Russula compacta]|nr:hypothetical protein BJV74DRAFT_853972 [Russula compacta]